MSHRDPAIHSQTHRQQMLVCETTLCQSGYHYIAGVDEAGRGPLAGPVAAAAVILHQDVFVPGIDDSKKLSKSHAIFGICQNTCKYLIHSILGLLTAKPR